MFFNLVASWWNDFWSKITVLEPLLLENTVNDGVLRRFLLQIHLPTVTRSVTLLDCYFTELLLYWTVTLLDCYFTELLLY